MKIVTINCPESYINAIEKLVGEDGLYPSRSELIRVAVRAFILKELRLAKNNLENKTVETESIPEGKSIYKCPRCGSTKEISFSDTTKTKYLCRYCKEADNLSMRMVLPISNIKEYKPYIIVKDLKTLKKLNPKENKKETIRVPIDNEKKEFKTYRIIKKLETPTEPEEEIVSKKEEKEFYKYKQWEEEFSNINDNGFKSR